MSIITWNCQGVSGKRFPATFKSLVVNYKVEIFVILEPRISGKKADAVIQKLGFAHSHRVEADGFSGGIWVLWSSNVSIDILTNHVQFIHMQVHCPSTPTRFLFTAVYGSPQAKFRKFLWQDLMTLNPGHTEPWLLSGDFNAIVSSTERRGGSDRTLGGCKLFSSFINALGLIDMGFHGHRFTWRRGTLLQRLDRALCNTQFSSLFPNSSVDHLPKILSDHRPICISKGTRPGTPHPRHFRFLASWLTHDDFPKLVETAWGRDTDIQDNITNFTNLAGTWNENVFGMIGKRKRTIHARLKGIRTQLTSQPFSDFLVDLEQSLAEELESIDFQEELLWLQKSSSDWITLGDKNTSFYHTKTLIKRRRDRVAKLKNSDGVWITDETHQSSMAFNFFKDTFSLDDQAPNQNFIKGQFPALSSLSLTFLGSHITLEEVKHALFDMKPLKAPGADGLHTLFFQSQWPTVNTSLHSFIQNVWDGKPLHPSLNRTLIALVPKQQHPCCMNDFRPISLCSVAYKTLTKVIANRLCDHLPHLVGSYQSSFIRGRSIIDNIIIAQEVFHSMRKKQGKGGWMAIKIDLEKAFDRLRWDFIQDTLTDTGIPSNMISAIMQCLTTPTMQVLWNGKPTQSFSPQRGIRQGDPLSPYIFVLCMERLSHAIQEAVNTGAWHPIKMGRRGIPLSHLFFADDLIVFGQNSDMQIATFQRIISSFCAASGHKVSLSKTKVYFSKNTSACSRRAICSQLGYTEMSSLGKYLGVPLITGRVSSSTYSYLSQRLQSKLAGWKAKTLSLAGRIALAKSALASIPLYTMQSCLLPASSCHELEKIMRKFIWGHTQHRKGVNLVKWGEVCQPKQHGGAGLLNLEAQNKAFISKLIYKIHTDREALWVKVLAAKYGLSIPGAPTRKSQNSRLWTNLLQCWPDATLHIKWCVGNAQGLRFWTDFWLGDLGPLRHLSLCDIPSDQLHQPLTDFWDGSSWRWDALHHMLPPNIIVQLRSVMVDSSAANKPSPLWNLTASGDFTTKSAYVASQELSWQPVDPIWEKVWLLPVAERIKTCTWLLVKGRLLTNQERKRRGLTSDDSCSLCHGGTESLNHVLRDCPLARGVWKRVLPLDMHTDFFRINLTDWLRFILKQSHLHVSWKTGILITIWKLWQTRNLRIFQQETFTVDSLVTHITVLVKHTEKSFRLLRNIF